MATGIEQVQFTECDNKSCKRRRYGKSGETAPGLYGHVVQVDKGERRTAEFYSCSSAPGHIGKAILGALVTPDNVAPLSRGDDPELATPDPDDQS